MLMGRKKKEKGGEKEKINLSTDLPKIEVESLFCTSLGVDSVCGGCIYT
jgi:hypothetical protein